jgi:hypothetical protein
MQQRPSRHFVQQLTKQAEMLSDQHLLVVLIQTSKIEPKVLEQWFTKNEIPFMSNLFKGDFEKKKTEWGVKSLPWLILTDKEHVVRAEGFAFSELDNQLKQIKGD